MTNSPPVGFRQTALSGAVFMAIAGSGTAHAVYQNPSGLGQVLIYPYYTVQTAGGNSFNTYLSIVNATTRAKALKVRFREGKNARQVLDFNLYVSANDVWTAALGPADSTASSPAMLVTADKSCTSPPIPAGGVAFNNFRYAGVNADGGPTTLDRTREGYFEVIEMANLTGTPALAVTHTAAGTPANCAIVQSDAGFTAVNGSATLTKPNGGLAGTYTLINVANGLNFGGNATALSQFSSTSIFSEVGSDLPDLGSASPAVATVVFDSLSGVSGAGTTTSVATYANGRDAVSATMMRSLLINEFALDLATKSTTDWQITFPTKYLYAGAGSSATAPPFQGVFGAAGACEPVGISIFSREEGQSPADTCGLPCGPRPPGPNICWAANVLSLTNGSTSSAQSSVLGSTNSIAVSTYGFQNGSARLYFVGTGPVAGLSSLGGAGAVQNAETGATISNATVNLKGLPAIGFMARTLNNGALSCTTFGGTAGTCAGSYGAAFDHKYFITATPTP